jgi:hypothetical protein
MLEDLREPHRGKLQEQRNIAPVRTDLKISLACRKLFLESGEKLFG